MKDVTAWAHLPNAKYIDVVLASAEAHPAKWAGAWGKTYPNGMTVAWAAALDAVQGAARDAVWDAVWRSTWDAALALIAYDDCAYMLESEVGELKILAALGDPRAILLLPACIAFNSIKEMEMI